MSNLEKKIVTFVLSHPELIERMEQIVSMLEMPLAAQEASGVSAE